VVVGGRVLSQFEVQAEEFERDWVMHSATSFVWVTDHQTGERTVEPVPKVYLYNTRTGRVYEFFNTCSSGGVELENGCFGDVAVFDQRDGFWTTPEPAKFSNQPQR